MKTKDQLIDDLIALAFAEDVGDGDHTTLSTIPADEMGKQQAHCKGRGHTCRSGYGTPRVQFL